MSNSMFSVKQRNFLRQGLVQSAFIFFCLVNHTTSFALCGMDEEDDYYGNAETCPFKNAVEGTEALTASDKAFLNAVESTRVNNRWYVRFFIGKPQVKLQELQNNSTGDFAGFEMGSDSLKDNLLSGSIATGYVWEQWAAEIELYGTKKFNFTLAPVYQGVTAPLTPVNAQGDIQQAALFINVQYIIPRLFEWYPTRLLIHLDGGGGGALKQTNINLSGPTGTSFQSGSERTFAAAGNLGVGARYQITPHILVDVAYRYFFLGKTNFGPALGNAATSNNPSVQFKSQKFTTNGFFIGAAYQF